MKFYFIISNKEILFKSWKLKIIIWIFFNHDTYATSSII